MAKSSRGFCHCDVCKGAARAFGRHPADPTGKLFGDKHYPLPYPHERSTIVQETSEQFILVDVSQNEPKNFKFLLRTDAERLPLWVALFEAKGKEIKVLSLAKNKDFSSFELLPLQYIFWNTQAEGARIAPSSDYKTLLQDCIEVAKNFPEDKTEAEELKARLVVEGVMEEPAAIESPPAEEKPEQEARRPKAGSISAKIWAICDSVYEEYITQTNMQADVLASHIRRKADEMAALEGVKSNTFSVQFGKWRSTKKL